MMVSIEEEETEKTEEMAKVVAAVWRTEFNPCKAALQV